MIINKSKANIILNCNLGFPIHTLKKHSSGKSGIKCTQRVTVDIFLSLSFDGEFDPFASFFVDDFGKTRQVD